MNRFALVASAVAVLLAGCGGQPQSAPSSTSTIGSQTPQPSATVSVESKASATEGTLEVTQQGTAPAGTVWYLRIEDMAAKPLLEKAYPGQRIALSKPLLAGPYRVLVWNRPCAGACPTTGEKGLGPLQDVCGAQLKMPSGRQLKVSAAIGADGTCSVKVNR